MATVPFLPKGRKSLYVRISVPRKLQRHFKHEAELWRTLETLRVKKTAIFRDNRS